MDMREHMNSINPGSTSGESENSKETCPSKDATEPSEDGNQGIDFEDEIVHGMTASYTEISFNTQSSEPDDSVLEDLNEPGSLERPHELPLAGAISKAVEFLNHLNGTVIQDGQLVSFVAEDLETKIKLSSPVSKSDEVNVWGSGMPWLYRQALTSHVPAVDSTILSDLEVEVGKIATSVDSLIENLASILHSMSALTVECLETYRDVVCKTCDAVDLNIKSMYQLMAKCEELSKSMKPIYTLADEIKEIKNFLAIFENTMV